MAAHKLVSFLLLCMLASAPFTAHAITCGQIASALGPCISYSKTPGTTPPPSTCCSGIKSINAAARTTPDRQAACRCLKTAAGSINGLVPNTVQNLPSKCGVNIPYKISTSTNCDTVK